eukprot:CAMPEP_0113914972 /NCGR_PEP_ID=MMETSP0780_2-20120614/30883_1 /TAXON_ID=652834 /ORGANISM="Palpitomonas bilix" /LENGTH=234 /DNA_ID=CAMNT_0000913309 /DNA_START=55 /DNA_END=756 /DNA_ORIENTATION=+ /assembly_acc=CAM_ASM_000599
MREVLCTAYIPCPADKFWSLRSKDGFVSEFDLYERLSRGVLRKVFNRGVKEDGTIFREMQPAGESTRSDQAVLPEAPFFLHRSPDVEEDEKRMDFVTDPPLMKGRILTSGVYTVEPIKKEDLPEEPVPEKVYKAYLKGGSLPEACGLTRQDVVELVRNYDGEWCKHYCKIELQVKVPIVGGLIERSIAKDLQAAYDDSSLQTMEFLEFLKRGGSLEEQRREAVECERQIREEMG